MDSNPIETFHDTTSDSTTQRLSNFLSVSQLDLWNIIIYECERCSEMGSAFFEKNAVVRFETFPLADACFVNFSIHCLPCHLSISSIEWRWERETGYCIGKHVSNTSSLFIRLMCQYHFGIFFSSNWQRIGSMDDKQSGGGLGVCGGCTEYLDLNIVYSSMRRKWQNFCRNGHDFLSHSSSGQCTLQRFENERNSAKKKNHTIRDCCTTRFVKFNCNYKLNGRNISR